MVSHPPGAAADGRRCTYVTERPDGGVRAVAWPYGLGRDQHGRARVQHLEHADGIGELDGPTMTAGLTDTQLQRLGALRAAARAVAGHALRVRPGGAAGPLDPDPMVWSAAAAPRIRRGPRLGRRATVLLAGQAAGQMWLEESGLLTAHRHLLTWVLADTAHDAILALPTRAPTAFLYGPHAMLPAGFTGRRLPVDTLIPHARALLADRWHQVLAISDRLMHAETIAPAALAGLLSLPAAAGPGFDHAAAARGALVAGYRLAAIEAIAEYWADQVGEVIARTRADDDAWAAAHPDRPSGSQPVTYTDTQRDAFRVVLTRRLVHLIHDRVERADGGLARSWARGRGVYELAHNHALPAPAALAEAMAAVGRGRYAHLVPQRSTLLARDAAWAEGYGELRRPRLLWSVPGTSPRCMQDAYHDEPGCGQLLAHEGSCDRASEPR